MIANLSGTRQGTEDRQAYESVTIITRTLSKRFEMCTLISIGLLLSTLVLFISIYLFGTIKILQIVYWYLVNGAL